MSDFETIRRAAMALPWADRASLAEELLSSLPEPPAMDEAEFARILIERSEAYDRGETTTYDWRESMARVREALAARTGHAAES